MYDWQNFKNNLLDIFFEQISNYYFNIKLMIQLSSPNFHETKLVFDHGFLQNHSTT